MWGEHTRSVGPGGRGFPKNPGPGESIARVSGTEHPQTQNACNPEFQSITQKHGVPVYLIPVIRKRAETP